MLKDSATPVLHIWTLFLNRPNDYRVLWDSSLARNWKCERLALVGLHGMGAKRLDHIRVLKQNPRLSAMILHPSVQMIPGFAASFLCTDPPPNETMTITSEKNIIQDKRPQSPHSISRTLASASEWCGTFRACVRMVLPKDWSCTT